jgi:hypothetical protein
MKNIFIIALLIVFIFTIVSVRAIPNPIEGDLQLNDENGDKKDDVKDKDDRRDGDDDDDDLDSLDVMMGVMKGDREFE